MARTDFSGFFFAVNSEISGINIPMYLCVVAVLSCDMQGFSRREGGAHPHITKRYSTRSQSIYMRGFLLYASF